MHRLPHPVVRPRGAGDGTHRGPDPAPTADLVAAGPPPGARARRTPTARARLRRSGRRRFRTRRPPGGRSPAGPRGDAGASSRLELARAVEAAAEAELHRKYAERPIRANVEFYTALLLEALAIPRAAFTAIFACARIAGYAAHYAEQRRTGRLIRPSALYVGPLA